MVLFRELPGMLNSNNFLRRQVCGSAKEYIKIRDYQHIKLCGFCTILSEFPDLVF